MRQPANHLLGVPVSYLSSGLVGLCLLGAYVLRAAAADCFPVPKGVVSWWPGDGSAADIIYTNNGVLQGSATAGATGLVAQAFGFNGTNASVSIADSPSL